MNENLAEMIKDENVESKVFNEYDLDIPVNENVSQETEEITETQPSGVGVVALCDWFEENHMRFENAGPVKVAIRGVDSRKTLIIAADVKGSILEDGVQERNLFVYNNADSYQVLNLPGSEMEIFNNGFKIVYNYNVEENIYLKTYGIKSGLFVIFCNMIEDMLVPYNIERFKKRDKVLSITNNENYANIVEKMNENADVEALQIMYKPIAKDIKNIVTNRDAVTWFLEKQKGIFDVNHLLKIDDIIIRQFT